MSEYLKLGDAEPLITLKTKEGKQLGQVLKSGYGYFNIDASAGCVTINKVKNPKLRAKNKQAKQSRKRNRK